MNVKTAVVVLIVLCLGLGGGLLYRHNTAVTQKRADEARIQDLSKQWTETSSKLTSQVEVNNALAADLESKKSELQKTAGELDTIRTTLGKTETEYNATKGQLEATRSDLAKRDARIGELENHNLALDKQAGEMKSAINDLEGRIADTQKKLAASEGDREFLLKELQRLQAEKAELERRFNDLVALREQVKKLKEDLAISRRLEWIRKGLYGSVPKRAGELMAGGVSKPAEPAATNVDLNVELKREGVVPAAPSTNAPANPPATPPTP